MKRSGHNYLIVCMAALWLVACSSDAFDAEDVEADCQRVCTWQTECIEEAQGEPEANSEQMPPGPFGAGDYDSCMQNCVSPNEIVAEQVPQCYEATQQFYRCLEGISCSQLQQEDNPIDDSCGAEQENSQAVCQDAAPQ